MKCAGAVHELHPRRDVEAEALQDRCQALRNGAALTVAHQAPGVVDEGQVLIERDDGQVAETHGDGGNGRDPQTGLWSCVARSTG